MVVSIQQTVTNMTKNSYSTGTILTFHTADYILFGLTLLISAAIGLYYAIRDRRKNTPDQYLLGNRNMSVIPVTLSMLTSFVSAVAILGVPAEIYTYDTMIWWTIVGFVISIIGAAHIFIPVFYNLALTSSFEYLELRFGRLTRTFSSILYVTGMLLYMAVVLYVPAVAVNVVTGLSLWISIFAVGIVCIFYTTLGGMKAVLWTDTIQICIMLVGMIFLLVKTSMDMGGIGNAWAIADQKQRIKFVELNGDPRVRMSILANIVGGGVYWCCIYSTNQAQIQRALSLPSLIKAKVTLWLNALGFGIIVSLSCLVGIVLFAFYSSCDPITSKHVEKDDQLVVLLAMDVFFDTPGLPGIIMTTLFCGSLSVMSSGLNAIAAVVLEDYIKTFCCTDIRHFKAKMLSMIIVLVGGIVCLGLTVIVSQFGTILQSSLETAYVLLGIVGGPLLGVFTLGILFPWTNQWGAIVGESASLAILAWIGLGSTLSDVTNAMRSPVNIMGCNTSANHNVSDWMANSTIVMPVKNVIDWTSNNGTTWIIPTSSQILDGETNWLHEIYKISHIWYCALAVVITVVIGILVSFITGYKKPSEVNPRLICPIFDVFFPFLPECIRKPLRFGVKHRFLPSGARRMGKQSEIHISLSINDDLETDTASNGIPALMMDIHKKDELNKEIDMLTRDSMDLGLIAEDGQLQMNVSDIPESQSVHFVNTSFGKT